MANKNITMKQYNGSGYDTLYPATTADQISGTISDSKIASANTWNNKQNALVSGSNIKTINSNSILGSGNLQLDGLPSQSGQSGKYLTTNGSTASWASVEALPSQSGQSGKLLTTNGSTASWTSTLPSHNQAASTISAGTFGGQVVANSSGEDYTVYCLRNQRLASTDTNPTVNGEICWTYS